MDMVDRNLASANYDKMGTVSYQVASTRAADFADRSNCNCCGYTYVYIGAVAAVVAAYLIISAVANCNVI